MLALSKIKGRLFYGWVIITAYLVIGTIGFGTRYSFGVFFKSIESTFDLSRAATSAIFSVYMIFGCIIAFLGGKALDRYGPRAVTFLMGVFIGLSLLLTSRVTSPWQLFFSYSVLLAFGTNSLYPTMMATTARWFDKKRGLAVGIAGIGVGLGPLAMSPFAAYLIANFDWRMAYIVMGLIAVLLIVPLSLLLKKDPSEIGVLPDGASPTSAEKPVPNSKSSVQGEGFSLTEAFRTWSFWLLAVSWLSIAFCLWLVSTHIVPHATDIGISQASAATVLALSGGMGIPGRMIIGILSDRIGRKASAVICSLLQAAALVWLIWAQELWTFYLFALVFGFGFGGVDVTTASLIGDIFGKRSLGAIMGMLTVAWGLGAAGGPIVGGLVFDITESYLIAFSAGIVAMVVTALSVALTRKEINIRKGLE